MRPLELTTAQKSGLAYSQLEENRYGTDIIAYVNSRDDTAIKGL